MGRAFEVRKASMEKTAKQRTKIYSRYGKELYMEAKNGGADPNSNLNLKRIIDKAKKDQVPADVIKRALDKAKGNIDENYNFIRYEGFGVSGTQFIVDCLTDNVNRTVSEVRSAFTKTGGKLGVSNSVLFNFKFQSYFEVSDVKEDELLELLLINDLNVDEVYEEDGHVYVYADQKEYNNIKTFLTENNINIIDDDIKWIPLTYVKLTNEDDINKVERLLEMLEESDDVQNVYHNVSK